MTNQKLTEQERADLFKKAFSEMGKISAEKQIKKIGHEAYAEMLRKRARLGGLAKGKKFKERKKAIA